MHLPTAAELLEIWDRGQAHTPAQRALALLEATGGQDASSMPAGARDAWLLALRERLFGAGQDAVTRCPACDEQLELRLPLAELRAAELPPAGMRYTLEHDAYLLSYRLPTAGDLAELDGDVGTGAALLLRRCVLDARQYGAPLSDELLPDALTTALGDAMAQRDPLADARLALDCFGCGHAWELAFDAASWVWCEIDDWAERLLADVHTLARAYGWSEAEVLALSPRRRRRYLELLDT